MPHIRAMPVFRFYQELAFIHSVSRCVAFMFLENLLSEDIYILLLVPHIPSHVQLAWSFLFSFQFAFQGYV